MTTRQNGTSKKNGSTPSSRVRQNNENVWRGMVNRTFPKAEIVRDDIMFILDTNVLMTKPEALFGFEEHNLLIPWKVLLELDKGKNGDTDRNMNARRTIEYIVTLIESVPRSKIHKGIPLVKPGERKNEKVGKLFLAVPDPELIEKLLDPSISDHAILRECLEARRNSMLKGTKVLVSKDKVMRIIANLLGIPAEDHFDDAIDTAKLTQGIHELPYSFLERQKKKIFEKDGRMWYPLKGTVLDKVLVNEVLSFCVDKEKNETLDLQVVKKPANDEVLAREFINYRKKTILGFSARNREQSIALNYLLDPAIKVVVLEGPAGSGKNFIALLAAFQQIVVNGRYECIVATRDALPIGEQIGFKPGSEREKMLQWMGGMVDNVAQIEKRCKNAHVRQEKKKIASSKGEEKETDFFDHLELLELNSIRGRSFQDTFVIFDENQNSTREQQKTLLTRHGNNSKTVCLGNFKQADRLLATRMSGFARVISVIRGVPWAVHLVMPVVERSEQAAFFEENL